MKAIWLILLVSVFSVAAEEKRTWTFSEDGLMRSQSGRGWSFKKNGRVDAALVGLEGTNVVLLAEDGTRRIIPAKSLSEDDRAYLKKAGGVSASEAADIEQKAAADSAESKRRSDIARMRAEAATKRSAAKVEREAAQKLNRGGMGGGAGLIAGKGHYEAAGKLEREATALEKKARSMERRPASR